MPKLVFNAGTATLEYGRMSQERIQSIEFQNNRISSSYSRFDGLQDRSFIIQRASELPHIGRDLHRMALIIINNSSYYMLRSEATILENNLQNPAVRQTGPILSVLEVLRSFPLTEAQRFSLAIEAARNSQLFDDANASAEGALSMGIEVMGIEVRGGIQQIEIGGFRPQREIVPQAIEQFQPPEVVRDYQANLQNLIKTVYLEIIQDDELVKAFKNPNDTDDADLAKAGRSALEICEAHTFCLLANWAQLRELEEIEELCPASFNSSRLTRYDTRLENLRAAKQLLQSLTDDQKTALKKRLLPVAPVVDRIDPEDPVQKAYIEIIKLAIDLVQGPLVTRTIWNLSGNEARGEQPIIGTNIFQSAIQEAQEIYVESQNSLESLSAPLPLGIAGLL